MPITMLSFSVVMMSRMTVRSLGIETSPVIGLYTLKKDTSLLGRSRGGSFNIDSKDPYNRWGRLPLAIQRSECRSVNLHMKNIEYHCSKYTVKYLPTYQVQKMLRE